MESALSEDVHEEFSKRVDEHFDRIDARLAILEKEMKSYSELAMNIERLSISTEKMCDEMQRHGKRLEALENRDGEKWRATAQTVLTVVIGAVIGYLLSLAGIIA